MLTPELTILTLNATVIAIAYLFIYPRFCGADLGKITKNDLIATAIILFIAGSLYWDSGVEFSLLLFSVNWFWFAFITGFIIELPVMIWYLKKHDVFDMRDMVIGDCEIDSGFGEHSLTFMELDKHSDTLEALGYQGSGYTWEAMVKAILKSKNIVDDNIDFDSESDMFAAYSDSKQTLVVVAQIIDQLASDRDLMVKALSNSTGAEKLD